uniref:Secreted protein n=2 Tax=Parascaris univalens TaxID=6257 RepID=A0A915BBN4_PARUN
RKRKTRKAKYQKRLEVPKFYIMITSNFRILKNWLTKTTFFQSNIETYEENKLQESALEIGQIYQLMQLIMKNLRKFLNLSILETKIGGVRKISKYATKMWNFFYETFIFVHLSHKLIIYLFE